MRAVELPGDGDEAAVVLAEALALQAEPLGDPATSALVLLKVRQVQGGGAFSCAATLSISQKVLLHASLLVPLASWQNYSCCSAQARSILKWQLSGKYFAVCDKQCHSVFLSSDSL